MESPALELDDIQSGVLRPRPTPFAATYIIFRIDDRNAGRELMRRLSTVVASAAHPESPARDTWVSVGLSFQGLKALGVPVASLDSFPTQFQEGMAARAKSLGDVGESSPEKWEAPLGSADVHVVLTAVSPDAEHLEIAGGDQVVAHSHTALASRRDETDAVAGRVANATKQAAQLLEPKVQFVAVFGVRMKPS